MSTQLPFTKDGAANFDAERLRFDETITTILNGGVRATKDLLQAMLHNPPSAKDEHGNDMGVLPTARLACNFLKHRKEWIVVLDALCLFSDQVKLHGHDQSEDVDTDIRRLYRDNIEAYLALANTIQAQGKAAAFVVFLALLTHTVQFARYLDEDWKAPESTSSELDLDDADLPTMEDGAVCAEILLDALVSKYYSQEDAADAEGERDESRKEVQP